MNTTLTFIGDIMLGRLVGRRYAKAPYAVVGEEWRRALPEADLVVANLESPVAREATTEGDHLQFRGNPDALDALRFVSLFSLSNNHITDCGTRGIEETIATLEQKGFAHTGIYTDRYEPYVLAERNLSIVVCTDMLNIPFASDCPFRTPRVGDTLVVDTIRAQKAQGRTVVVYAHIGMLFTRYPNPFTRDYLHSLVEAGADVVVSCHSHCLGGMETYKGRPIFHSLGDFVMDGNSFRRRRSAALTLTLDGEGHMVAHQLTMAETDDSLLTTLPPARVRERMAASFQTVSGQLARHGDDYARFFRTQYRREMMAHTLSTLRFLVHQRGIVGMARMVGMRMGEVLRMGQWMTRDRSKDRRDDDAIRADRKKMGEEELFG